MGIKPLMSTYFPQTLFLNPEVKVYLGSAENAVRRNFGSLRHKINMDLFYLITIN